MKRMNREQFENLIYERVKKIEKMDRLLNKIELLESEIKELAGDKFDVDDFFQADGAWDAAKDDIEKEFGEDEYMDFGDGENINQFVRDLELADDEEAERLAPEYYPEKRRRNRLGKKV